MQGWQAVPGGNEDESSPLPTNLFLLMTFLLLPSLPHLWLIPPLTFLVLLIYPWGVFCTCTVVQILARGGYLLWPQSA